MELENRATLTWRSGTVMRSDVLDAHVLDVLKQWFEHTLR